ncbi:hypothetical protein E6Q11_00495 [Candidatus Dojkabacteria bacterium]|uniref:Terminase n=1 Tax=Candidatus Dojkabacteria bacterium TaxID=2099670 RepID=A0A5C7JAV9_9BACT|nr:MAG: hypothetical protein E6Q11_00495 [Candidatus Dojkabacteria bacterium]
MSYADRHKAKYAGQVTARPVLVAGAAKVKPSAPAAAIDPRIAQYMAGLDADLLRLKQLQRPEREQLKFNELLPRYLPLINELVRADHKQDCIAAGRIAFYCMVWSLDIRDWSGAIYLCDKVLNPWGISSFDDFSRTPANIVAGQMASWCNEQHSDFGGLSAEPVLSLLVEFAGRHARTLLEPIMADIAKAQGGEAELKNNPIAALEHYRQALSFNSASGVKRLINRLQKGLAAQSQSPL